MGNPTIPANKPVLKSKNIDTSRYRKIAAYPPPDDLIPQTETTANGLENIIAIFYSSTRGLVHAFR